MDNKQMMYLDSIILNKAVGSHYIVKRVGSGSFSVGYKATSKGKETLFVKVPKEKQFFEPLRAVGKAYASMKGEHEGVIKFYDYLELRDGDLTIPAIVTEFSSWPSIKQVIRKKGIFSLDNTAKYGLKILDALEFLHDQGIYHGDLSPSNIMIDKDSVKLTDLFHKEVVSSSPVQPRERDRYADQYLPERGTGYDSEISPSLLRAGNIEPNAYSDLYMLARVLNYMMTEEYGMRLTIPTDEKEINYRKMQDVLDRGQADLSEKNWNRLSELTAVNRGYHSVHDMREDTYRAVGLDFRAVEILVDDISRAIAEGARDDGTNLNIDQVDRLYQQLLEHSQHMQIDDMIEATKMTIIQEIAQPFYRSMVDTAKTVDMKKKEFYKKSKPKQEFLDWHAKKTKGLGQTMTAIKESKTLDSLLKGYRGPDGRGERLYK